ncbi:MAG: PAS domain S-box protein [Anaerolineales bacterium]
MSVEKRSKQQLLEELALQREKIDRLEKELDELRRFSQMWETLMANTPDLVYFKDRKHRFTQVSQAYADIFDKSRQELLGKTAVDLWPKEGEEIIADEKQVLSGEEMIRKERKVTTPDGKSQWYLLTKIPIYQNGEIVGFFAIDKDISAKKEAEKECKKEEQEKIIILDSLVEHVIHEDTHMKVLWANKAACESAGMTREELIGRYCYQIWPQREDPCPDCPVIQAMETEKPQETEKFTPDGRAWYIRGYPVKNEDGDVVGGIEVTLDITERKQALRQNIKRRRYLESLLNAAPDAIVTLDAKHRIVEWNPGARQLFGYTAEEVKGKYLDELITQPDVIEEALEITKKIQGGHDLPPTEVVRYRKDGTPVKVILAGSPIMIGDEMVGAVGVYTDISERVQMEEELRAMALRDELTGLYNRRGFSLLAEQHLKIANRENRRLILIYADIDNLKLINDTYGHPQGDLALQDVAKILKDTYRKSDVIARIGGDEFVLLALESEPASPQTFTHRLKKDLKTQNEKKERPYELSLSIGWACYDPQNPRSLEELLHNADQAMYSQKQNNGFMTQKVRAE